MDSKINRRKFLYNLGLGGAASVALRGASSAFPFLPLFNANAAAAKPNVIFITVDDLNDFPGPFGGYSQILTPNIDRLAARSMVFQNAYTAIPLCGSSRSAIMSGIAPYRSGAFLQDNIVSPDIESRVKAKLNIKNLSTIPRYFKSQGYKMIGGGKLYHGGFSFGNKSEGAYDANVWDSYYNFRFDDIAAAFPGEPNYRNELTIDGLKGAATVPGGQNGLISRLIGAHYNTSDAEAMMPDKQLAKFADGHLKALSGSPGTPFFLACGFYRPHLALYVPQRFYNLYPLDTIRTQNFMDQVNDLQDVPEYALKNSILRGDQEDLMGMTAKENRNGAAQTIQAYLASISFVDECVGQLISALERYNLMSNTMIVLTSDHGWFLGEKLGWRKFKHYERATRIPVMMSGPGISAGSTNQVISTLDLFPTLVDYVQGLNTAPVELKSQFDGRSLRSIIQAPHADSGTYAISSYLDEVNKPYYTIRTSRWRYTVYPTIRPGGLREELFDLSVDRQETRNLIYWEPIKYGDVRTSLRKLLQNRVINLPS